MGGQRYWANKATLIRGIYRGGVRELWVGGVKKSKGHVIAAKPHMAQHTGRKRSNWQKVCWWKYYGSGKMKKKLLGKKRPGQEIISKRMFCRPVGLVVKARRLVHEQLCNITTLCILLRLCLYILYLYFVIDAAPLTTTIQRQWVQSQSLYCYALATCSNAISHFELRVHAMWTRTATNSFCITVADVKKKDMSLLKPHFQTHE